MSIPRRLWRILRGRIALARERAGSRPEDLDAARERLAEAQAEADAARELAAGLEGVRSSTPVSIPGTRSPDRAGTERPVSSSHPRTPTPSQPRDPHAGDYELLQLAPGSDLAALDAAYQARLAEARPERYPEGSPERTGLEARRRAIEAAYERLRDALNVTETRFEKLEF